MRGESAAGPATMQRFTSQKHVSEGKCTAISDIVGQFLIAAGVSSIEELRSVTVWLCQYATYLLRNLQQAAISSANDIAPVAVNRAGTTYM